MKRVIVAAGFVLLSQNATAIGNVCSESGGFGQKFGASNIKGEVTLKQMNGVTFVPDEAFPPFGYFEAGITRKSGKVWSVSASARFETPEAAKEYRKNLLEAFSSSMKITERVDTRLGETKLYTGSKGFSDTIAGQTKFYHSDGLKIEVSEYTDDKSLLVKCADLELEQKHVSEVMGR
jgi:hypothetical protein